MRTRRQAMRGRGKRRNQANYEPKPQRVQQVKTKGLGFSDSVRTNLQYTDTISVTSASYQTVYVYRGNSCYDPDQTSTGHQPLYFDTYSQVYTKYKVYGASITLHVGNDQSRTVGLAIVPTTNPLSVGASAYEILDQPRAQWKLIPAVNINSKSMRARYSTTEILGLNPKQIEDEDYSAAVTTSPGSLWYINLFAFNVDAAQLDIALNVVVKIDYDVRFYDRVNTSASLRLFGDHEDNNKQEQVDVMKAIGLKKN